MAPKKKEDVLKSWNAIKPPGFRPTIFGSAHDNVTDRNLEALQVKLANQVIW